LKRGVLGIDAAWTEGAPSGVAWIVEGAKGWHVAGCAPSYAEFCGLADGQSVDWSVSAKGVGAWPDIEALLAAAQRIERAEARVVAVDMPLAIGPCVARRRADNAISSVFGAQGCSTHSPTPSRPGEMGLDLMRQLDAAGFPLAVAEPEPEPERRPEPGLAPGRRAGWQGATGPHALEVYPHPALLRLLDAPYRVPYKVSRSSKFWKGESVQARVGHLLSAFREIEAGLHRELGVIPVELPEASRVKTLASLKRFEDALDSLICAWIGMRFLEGEADAFGDATAAIWVPAAQTS
jgi:predicted RNase H-like nuclease